MQGPRRLPVLHHPAHGRKAAHLVDHVFPRLPVRQWALSFPKRLRYHLDDAETLLFEEAHLTSETVQRLQATIRERIVRLFVRRALLDKAEREAMCACEHGGGLSIDAGVRIEGQDRRGLERLLRYCVRPAFTQERLRQIDAEPLVYESPKPGPGGRLS